MASSDSAAKDATAAALKDFWKKNCTNDPQFAYEQYVSLYHSCFKPATSPAPYGRSSSSYYHRVGIMECRKRLLTLTNASIAAGASKDRADDILELGLRAVTGTHLKFDEPTGIALFHRIINGNYPESKKAIAASLLCKCIIRTLPFDPENFLGEDAFMWADYTCKYGLFTHTCHDLLKLYNADRRGRNDPVCYARFTNLWNAYDKFCEETGLQRPFSKQCATCHEKFPRRSMLKRCAGHCFKENKPLYCSRKCQRKHWSRHKKWCKVVSDDDDSEWASDSEAEDWEYSESEEAPDIPEESSSEDRKIKVNFKS
ncbi:hypothetical protein D9613_003871 [Agrocybe pediades]|uniref:MYND-type domain-containing protein n=1 Tax=Agrocybe pediades TaxID=84607 RepID=A0A8H4VKT0_9AGAR|nr:hypothetical protein D9613_003871 [Agrocybe pediades]